MTEHKKENSDTVTKKIIYFTLQELVTYTVFVITFGASVYTFFEAIPKIDELTKTTNELNNHITASQVAIQYLTKQVDNLQNRAK